MDKNKIVSMVERLEACIQFMGEIKFALLADTVIPTEETAPLKASQKAVVADAPVAQEEAPVGSKENPYEDLQDMTEEDLTGILEAYELKLPRKTGKRDHKIALMDAVLKGIEDGVIQVEADEDGQETDKGESETSEPANDGVSKEDDTSGDDEDSESDTSEDSDDAPDTELPELPFLHEMIEAGTIKPTEMKKFLSAVFAEDENCKECKGCSKETTIDCYVQTMTQCLTDDDEDTHEFSEPYLRNEEVYCCGVACKEKSGKYTCQGHCKQEFELE